MPSQWTTSNPLVRGPAYATNRETLHAQLALTVLDDVRAPAGARRVGQRHRRIGPLVGVRLLLCGLAGGLITVGLTVTLMS